MMFETRRQTAVALGWLGLLPFAGLAAATFLPAPGWLTQLLIGYALLILAFVSGSLWSSALARSEDDTPAPLILSNVLALAGLPALLLQTAPAAAWLAFLFALHAAAEWRWVRAGQPGWYRRLRLLLSTAVVALLLITATGGAYA